MSPIILYAELLLHIPQVTLFATLPSHCNESTRVDISSDRGFVSVSHGGDTATIELPSPVPPDAKLILPATKTKDLHFRLKLSEGSRFTPHSDIALDNDCPWPASSLTCDTQIACRSCKTILVANTVTTWKDLPSENWAEMMDFWHCHKPDTHEYDASGTQGFAKGYNASSRLGATPGVGLVDICHVLLSQQDCQGIQRKRLHQPFLECVSCHELVGIEDERLQGLRLDKWSLSLRSAKEMDWTVCAIQTLICAQLLALIASQATHKFIAYSGTIEYTTDAILLWVFTPDLRYSTSFGPGGPKRALKILYQKVSDPAYILEKQGMRVDELELPDYVLYALYADLQASKSILPVSARKLQNWDVGLLER